MCFSDADRQRLQGLTYDPKAEPSYELLKSCLVWPDERPEEITNEGYEVLCDLWIVRGFMHRNVAVDEWGLDPPYFQRIWQEALRAIPAWPGFRRLDLTPAEREYLRRAMSDIATNNDH